jgi:GAF domain-containing protein
MPDLIEVQRICGLLDREQIGRSEFLALFTRQMALDVGCSRAGVRILLDSAPSRILRCVAMYEPAVERAVSALDIDGDSAPDYFRALVRDGAVMAADARHDPATAGFAVAYLVPMNVYSLLDVNFSVNGLMFGTFSCEQVGEMQQWTPRQLRLLRRIAARASLSLLQAVTATVDTTPGALWDPSSPSRLITMTMPLAEDEKH